MSVNQLRDFLSGAGAVTGLDGQTRAAPTVNLRRVLALEGTAAEVADQANDFLDCDEQEDQAADEDEGRLILRDLVDLSRIEGASWILIYTEMRQL